MDGSFGPVSLMRLRPFLKAHTCSPKPIKEAIQAPGETLEPRRLQKMFPEPAVRLGAWRTGV